MRKLGIFIVVLIATCSVVAFVWHITEPKVVLAQKVEKNVAEKQKPPQRAPAVPHKEQLNIKTPSLGAKLSAFPTLTDISSN